MPARIEFLQSHRAVLEAQSLELLIPNGLGSSPHNDRARILRNGLAVQYFAILEEFLRSRAAELLSYLSGGPVAFASLPVLLQEAATRGALEALAYQSRTRGSELTLATIQQVATAIGSTTLSGYQFTEMTFGYDSSNLAPRHLSEFLASINVGPDSWRQMTMLKSRLGFGQLPLDEAFRNGATARHSSAHSGLVDTSISQLTDFHQAELLIALTFDALASRAVRKLRTRVPGQVTENEIRVRELRQRDARTWAEAGLHAKSALKLHRDEPDFAGAFERCQSRNELLVAFDRSGFVTDWWSSDCP